VLKDVPVFAEPSKSSAQIETAHQSKYVNITGSTRDFLRILLKSGKTGYLEPDAVTLVSPTDQIFTLTTNTGVLEKPNRWSKKLAEVHQGHQVHAVGVALSYVRIRMKSGLEGFIPMSALE